MRETLLTCLFLGGVVFAAADSQNGGNAAGGQGVLPEVLIEAEHNKPLPLSKPPLSFEVKEDQPIEKILKQTDRSLMNRLPSQILKSNVFKPEISVSSRVIAPSQIWIVRPWAGDFAHVFHPQNILSGIHAFEDNRNERKKAVWEMDVVDGEGKSIQHFSGSGVVPKRIPFDGRGKDGKWLEVGETYMGVLKNTDSQGRIHTAYGRPFKIAGLSLKNSSSFSIDLDAGVLFSTSSAVPQFSPFGRELIQEAAQLLQRYYPGFAPRVSLSSKRLNSQELKKAVSLCSEEIAKRLIISSSKIQKSWSRQDAGAEGVLRILVQSQARP
jgi:hypothetical protein